MKQAAIAAGREPEGLWMPMSVRQVEQLILEGRLRIQRNRVTISAMMSAGTDRERWDNYWLAKERAVNKIDAAVALCMAVSAADAFKSMSAPTSPSDDPDFNMGGAARPIASYRKPLLWSNASPALVKFDRVTSKILRCQSVPRTSFRSLVSDL